MVALKFKSYLPIHLLVFDVDILFNRMFFHFGYKMVKNNVVSG